MNKKYALFSVVLIAIMALGLLTGSAHAFIAKNGSDNGNYQQYGPAASSLLIHIYTSLNAEFTDFSAGNSSAIDIMDFPLSPTQYGQLRTADPNNQTWIEAYYNEFSLFEWDLNDAVAPTNSTSFRIGLSYLLNRDYFVNTYSGLAGSATGCFSPIGSCTGYYDPNTPTYEVAPARTTISPYPNDYTDMLDAFKALLATPGMKLVPDPQSGWAGYLAFNWTTAYPNLDPTYSTYGPGYISAGGKSVAALLVFARSDSLTARNLQGTYIKEMLDTLGEGLPGWTANYMSTLVGLGLVPSGYTGVHLNVKLYSEPRAICFNEAMGESGGHGVNDYYYNVYTGGWSLSRDPDFLQYYTSFYAPSATNGYEAGAHNYGAYIDPIYDPMINGNATHTVNSGLLLTSAPGGSPTAGTLSPPSGTATFWAYQAQLEMMGTGNGITTGCALIPCWYTSGYMAELNSLANSVNGIGVGLISWYTFLNAYSTLPAHAGEINWGFQSAWSTLNPITAPWVWDWNILGEIYDGLYNVNPYNTGQDLPYLAYNWTYSTRTTTGTPWTNDEPGTYTVINFLLRQDVNWQAVPYTNRSPYVWNSSASSNQINGPFTNQPFTPVDVAFTIIYLRDLDLFDTTQNGYLVDPTVDHVAINPIWESLWNESLVTPAEAAATGYAPGTPVWFNTTAIDGPFAATFPDGTPLTWLGNEVVFDPTVPANGIYVYLSNTMTWLGLHRVGGLPIMPFFLWSQLPLDAWDYNGVSLAGAGWLDPTFAGANLLYGTGPYILVPGTAAGQVPFGPTTGATMIPYKAGAISQSGSYTEVNTANYFWYPQARISFDAGGVSVVDPIVYIYYSGTQTYYIGASIQNLPNTPTTVSLEFSLGLAFMKLGPPHTIIWRNSTIQVTGVTIPAASLDYNVASPPFNVGANMTAPAGYIGPFIEIDVGLDGVTTTWQGWQDNLWTKYTLGVAYANPAAVPGDISGGALTSPYWGSDGVVGTADLHLLGVEWGLSSVGASPFSLVRRADMMNVGTVGTADLHTLGVDWGATWSISSEPSVYPGLP